MKFGAVPIDEADGAILAHAVRIDGLTLKKGDVVTPDRRNTLAEAGVRSVLAARLEGGDVGEDEAAARIAGRLAGLLSDARRRSPAGSTCSPKPPGSPSSTGTRSTGSMRSTRRSPSPP